MAQKPKQVGKKEEKSNVTAKVVGACVATGAVVAGVGYGLHKSAMGKMVNEINEEFDAELDELNEGFNTEREELVGTAKKATAEVAGLNRALEEERGKVSKTSEELKRTNEQAIKLAGEVRREKEAHESTKKNLDVAEGIINQNATHLVERVNAVRSEKEKFESEQRDKYGKLENQYSQLKNERDSLKGENEDLQNYITKMDKGPSQ